MIVVVVVLLVLNRKAKVFVVVWARFMVVMVMFILMPSGSMVVVSFKIPEHEVARNHLHGRSVYEHPGGDGGHHTLNELHRSL